MKLIHSDQNRSEIQAVQDFSVWDVMSGLSHEYESNTFYLCVPEQTWKNNPIQENHFLYEPETEWGGRVEGIANQPSGIVLTGPTWRGLLSRKIISPPSGQAYRTIVNVDANAAIATLVGTSFGDLVQVKTDLAGVNVSGQFRYTNLLGGIHTMLGQYGLRLKVEFDGETVWLSTEYITDLSDENELSQDYSVDIESEKNKAQAYNHLICLGQGELTEREVIHLYRTDDGEITYTPLPSGIEDRQTVLDFPNAESTEELTRSGVEKLIEFSPTNNIKISIPDTLNLNIGDLVGGRDYVTGQNIVQPITQVIRRIDSGGESINYKVGE